MLRIWITSALTVGVLVAGVLWFTRRGTDERGVERRDLPATLTEADVRNYLAFQPEFARIIGEALRAYAKDPSRDLSAQAEIEAACLQHHMSLADWENLRHRVEFAVEVLRYEKAKDERERRYQDELLNKEEILARSEGAQKKVVQSDIDALKAKHAAGPPPLHPSDRKLTMAFWADLDRFVPKSGPPPPPR